MKVRLVWVPKYRKRILTRQVAIRLRDVLRQIALEHELDIITGKVSSDHVHMFIGYKPIHNISKIMQWLKWVSSSEEDFLGRHFWGRGYLAVSSGNITGEMTQSYIDEQ